MIATSVMAPPAIAICTVCCLPDETLLSA